MRYWGNEESFRKKILTIMKYVVRTYQENGEVKQISVDAANENEANRQVKAKGLIPLSVQAVQTHQNDRIKGKGKFDILIFSHQLLMLLKAGLSLIDAIETLREKEQGTTSRLVLDKLTTHLYEGLSLSSALEKDPEHFNHLYVAIIKSSEKTGDLTESLKRFIDYQVQINLVRKKIISASIYPTLLLMVGGLVILFLMFYVVPKFSTIYAGKMTNLPLLSQWLLNWGLALSEHSAEVTFGFVGVLVISLFLLTRKTVLNWLVQSFLRLEFIKEKAKIYQLARFYRTLGMLLKGGIPITIALEMVSDLLKFSMANQLSLASSDIKNGLPMSLAMEKYQLTTPVAVRMMRVGEKSGQLGAMLENIGDFYDDEISVWMDWFTKLFEPILMTLIGLVVGLVVVLMYMPIFDLAGSIE